MVTGRGLHIWLLCLAVLLLLFFGGQKNPLISLLAGVLTPLPVLLAGWRLGDRAALLLAVCATLAVVASHPGLPVILANLGFLELLLMGVLLSGLQYRGMAVSWAIIYTVVALNLVVLLFLSGQALVMGITLQALLAQKSAEIMETIRQVLGDTGGAPVTLIPGMSAADVERLLQRLLPGLVITNSGLVAWINVILARRLTVAFGWGEQEPPLYYFAVPEWLIFGVLGAGFLLLIPVYWLRLLSLNLLVVMALLYFSQGVAVVSAWFHRFGLPRVLRIIGYPLLFLYPLVFIVITLGLTDLWFDFRRLNRQPEDA